MFYPTTCVGFGTGAARMFLAVFLGSLVRRAIGTPRGESRTFGFRLGARASLRPSLPTPLNRLFRQPAALPLLRPRVDPRGSPGILTGSAIGLAIRLILRSRLTLIRRALIRKPWSCGVGESHPHYRYSFLHLPFRTLQRPSRDAFAASGMLPYHIIHGFGGRLMPDYYPCAAARLVSCYALFE